jgi:hypothetical protein
VPPCEKFERTLPTPLREDFGPNAKARDAIEVDFCEAFPLPEGIGESPCRQCATRSTPLGNPPSPPPRLRPQPSYVEVIRRGQEKTTPLILLNFILSNLFLNILLTISQFTN